MTISSAAQRNEQARVQNAYARRAALETRYSKVNPGHLYMIQERERRVLSLLSKTGRYPLNGLRILEVGCGTGQWLRDLVRWGARPEEVVGVELLEDRAAEARRSSPEGIRVVSSDVAQLPFPEASFDLIIQSTMFSSILDAGVRRQAASEMVRVLSPGGMILWYDFFMNNPRNPDVQGMTRGEITRLFPNCRVDLQTVTLAPPLTRALAPYSRTLCALLEKIPLLRTHYLGAIHKI